MKKYLTNDIFMISWVVGSLLVQVPWWFIVDHGDPSKIWIRVASAILALFLMMAMWEIGDKICDRIFKD